MFFTDDTKYIDGYYNICCNLGIQLFDMLFVSATGVIWISILQLYFNLYLTFSANLFHIHKWSLQLYGLARSARPPKNNASSLTCCMYPLHSMYGIGTASMGGRKTPISTPVVSAWQVESNKMATLETVSSWNSFSVLYR